MRSPLDGTSGFNRRVGIGEMRELLTVKTYSTVVDETTGEETTGLNDLLNIYCAIRQVEDIAVRDEKARNEYEPSYLAVAVNDERLRDNMFLTWRGRSMRITGIQRDYQHNTMHIRIATDSAHKTT